MNIYTVKARLEDFIQYKKRRVDKICAVPLRDTQKYYFVYSQISEEVGVDLFITFIGKYDLLRFINEKVYDLESTAGEDHIPFEYNDVIRVKFEEFSVFCLYMSSFRGPSDSMLDHFVVLLDVKRVVFPRKHPVKIIDLPRSLSVIDRMSNAAYILPELRYPKNITDLREFVLWLRVKKQYLFVKYKYQKGALTKEEKRDDSFATIFDADKQRFPKGVCREPSWTRRWSMSWWKSRKTLEIYFDEGAYTKARINDEQYFSSWIDFRNGTSKLNLQWITDYCDILPPKEITQETVNEFVDWQNNRFEVIRR